LDAIPGEGKTLKDIIESGEEIPDELWESLQALAKAVQPLKADLAGSLIEPSLIEPMQKAVDIHLERIAESVGRISSGTFNWVDVEDLLGGEYKVIRILQEMLEEERKAWVEAERAKKEERNRYWLALGVTIVIGLVGWVIALVSAPMVSR